MIPVHLPASQTSYRPVFVVVLVAAGLGGAVLVGLGVAAFARRQSRSYLLVVIALAALLGHTALGALVLVNVIAPPIHHLGEHTLDVAIAGLLLGAIYFARTTPDAYRGRIAPADHADARPEYDD